MQLTIQHLYRLFAFSLQRLLACLIACFARPGFADTADDDTDDYDPLPGRTDAQIEALIFNFDEVVETVVLYTALFALLLILLALAGSMRLRRWVGYTVLSICSLAWFAFFEQHATGIYWIGIAPSLAALTSVGALIICAHFLLAAYYARARVFRVLLPVFAMLSPILLVMSWDSVQTEVPLGLILLALISVAAHFLGMPRFTLGPQASPYTRRNGIVVAVAVAMTIFVVFGELDEGFDTSFAVRSLFVAIVLLFAFFLVQSVVRILRDRDASQRHAIAIAKREAEQAKALLEAEKKYARAKEVARRHTERLATASHDIRQPITSLRATMATVTKDQTEEVQSQLRTAFDYLDELAKSYMETEKPPNAPAPEMAADGREVLSSKLLCETLDRMFRNEAEAKDLTFELEVEERQISAVPLVLTRILSNLLANAIAHTAEGKVSLAAGPGQGGYDFVVSNTAAMPDDLDRKMAFEHGVKGAASDGSGYGLAIVKRLSASSGMTLDWSSDQSAGTSFTLRVSEVSAAEQIL